MEILNFIEQYYYLILLLLFIIILILELMILLIKKKDPSVLSGINSVLPNFIKDAEMKFNSGEGFQKKLCVVQNVRDYLRTIFNIENFAPYSKYVDSKIEEILSTPQKKGD